MPRVTTIKTNFTAGEISPRLLARVDIARYANGAKKIYNAYSLVHGGARRRQGTRFIAFAKEDEKQTRLVPFIFSRDQAFVVEAGDDYMRFFSTAGQIESSPGTPYEISSPYQEADLDDVHYVQGADTMFLSEIAYQVRKLVRYSNTNWKLSAVDWDVPPSDEIGERPNTTVTFGGVSGNTNATAGAAAFQNADVGRYIEVGAGRAIITAFTSTTVVDITVIDAFASVGAHAANAWKITESPKTTCTASAAGPIGAAITLTLGANGWKETAQVNHEGSFVEINGGLVEITEITNDTVTAGVVHVALTGTTAAPSGSWALRQEVWNSVDGYPRAVTLYEQRLVAGGSPAFPQTVWGSRPGEYMSFADGANDDDAFAFELASDQVNPIEHLASTRVLLPLTYGAEFSMVGGTEKPITPTNVQAKAQTVYGCDITRPVRVANEIIFVQRGGRKIRALGYRVESDAFNAPDISVLSEHITGDGIYEMAFAQEPDNIVWMVRADGHLVSLSIDRDQDAIGFAESETEGEVESVAVIPRNGVDELWMVVVRTIDGETKRCIERMEEGLQTDSAITGAVDEDVVTSAVWAAGVATVAQTSHGYSTGDIIRFSGFTPDAWNGEHEITVTGAGGYTFELEDNPGATSVVGTAAIATTTWAGLEHLEGETVDVVADSLVAGQFEVSGAEIELNFPAYEVEIGRHYRTEIVTLPPEVGTGQGSAQGNAISIHEVIVRLYQSIGCKVGNENIPFRRFGESVMNQPIAPFTGDKKVNKLGWGKTGSGDSDGTVTIVQDQPLPLQVLGVITRLTVNDG